jgi:beta propeller repeat protein
VVWTSVSAPANFDVALYELVSGTSQNLTSTPTEREFLTDIDAGNVVWTHVGGGARADIVLYQTATGSQSVLALSDASVQFQQPAIRGRYVTFLRVTNQIDVVVYDWVLGLSVSETNDTAFQAKPRLGGGYVVYEDQESGSRVHVLPHGGVHFSVTDDEHDPGEQRTPDADGDTIVYVDDSSGTDQLFVYDMFIRFGRQLTSVASAKMLPRISGTRVVWTDDRNGNLDIYAWDLRTNREAPLVVGPGDQYLPDIDGLRVVYTDNSSGFEQVYLVTMCP